MLNNVFNTLRETYLAFEDGLVLDGDLPPRLEDDLDLGGAVVGYQHPLGRDHREQVDDVFPTGGCRLKNKADKYNT